MSIPSYKRLAAMAAPIILANSTTPLLGLADTAVIGNVADSKHLGAIAVGALIFSFVYWGFGFLRMSTTGYISQASATQDSQAHITITIRALLLAAAIGILILALQWPLVNSALWLFGASSEVEQLTETYFKIRIWGAPATLITYVLLGYLIGNGLNKTLLLIQLILNGLNIVLDVLFAGHMEMGAEGVAYGTLLAEWITVFIALQIVVHHLKKKTDFSFLSIPWRKVTDWNELKNFLQANTNILIRTLFLLFGFALFTDQGARFGDTVLAANHLLLQLISFSAFFLDGYAHVSEYYVGRAAGSADKKLFNKVVQRTSILAAITATLLAVTLLILGHSIIFFLTDIDAVRNTASQYLTYPLVYIVLSFAAFQLDGIFIGATYTKALRNASILSTLCFIILSALLIPYWKNHGLWTAFIIFIVLRAVFLGCYFRRLQNRLQSHRN